MCQKSVSVHGDYDDYRGVLFTQNRLRISYVNDTKTKAQTFRFRSLLSERNKNVLMCSMVKWLKQKRNFSIYSKKFETKPKHFDVFQIFFKQKRN